MTWDEALAALGRTGHWEPQDLGPMPEALVAQAQAILARLAAEIRRLEERQAEVGRELAGVAGSTSAEPSSPQFLDTRV